MVIANLSGSYEAQTKDLARIMSNLQQESRRQAQIITPVQLAGNEIYQILKKRLFTELPGDSLVDSVAEAFAEEVKAAEDPAARGESVDEETHHDGGREHAHPDRRSQGAAGLAHILLHDRHRPVGAYRVSHTGAGRLARGTIMVRLS